MRVRCVTNQQCVAVSRATCVVNRESSSRARDTTDRVQLSLSIPRCAAGCAVCPQLRAVGSPPPPPPSPARARTLAPARRARSSVSREPPTPALNTKRDTSSMSLSNPASRGQPLSCLIADDHLVGI